MFGHRLLLWLAGLTLLATQPLLAANVQVGTCKPKLQSFSTISAAVSSVPPGSTVQVCPGSYAEQVVITQPLTLEGVASGTVNQALITVPAAGLLPNATSIFGESMAAQVLVLGAGPVNISNIAVDGTGGDMSCTANIWVAGIFYGSSSSGTVSQVRASSQTNGNCGVGIWAENGDSSNQSITIQDSSVYNVDSAGIFVGSGATPTLSVEVRRNVVVNSGSAAVGIQSQNVTGELRNNSIDSPIFGVYDNAPAVNVVANTFMATGYGIFLESGGAAVDNNVSGSSIGVILEAGGATVTGNRILASSTAGIELSCFAAGVRGNFINDAPIGIDQAPAGIGSNTFANTVTTVNGCAVAAAAPHAMRSMRSVSPNSFGQWHTPATPLGTRTK
jgi:Right handed beta helix region